MSHVLVPTHDFLRAHEPFVLKHHHIDASIAIKGFWHGWAAPADAPDPNTTCSLDRSHYNLQCNKFFLICNGT